MKLSIIAASVSLFSFSSAAAIRQITLSYDTKYDNANLDLLDTSCSNGENGLVTKGYPTAGSIPNHPHVGGIFAVEVWNSPKCGSCYKVTYPAQNKSIFVTAIDHATGFNVAKQAMDDLTGGLAEQLGRVPVTYQEVAASECGM